MKIGEEMGKIEGKAEGRRERDIEVAKNLLKAGVSADIISQTTGMFKKVCQAAFLVQLNFQSIRKENIKLRHS
ncbi:hypothetical protein ID128_05060 [Candidatus Wolbachia massiliensis]|uniref:Transposase n=1 Tax=Candidatus Wolbachia massiliensis TaxID=1845000 RepID=A0A7L7YR45_9RICK|nr:hypothetical protein [Candidatus Wolbachia massiliensis]QOD38147.1 hypothetical protein ID128_05060 [Candidatus Wolbachia massiliensis]